MSGNELSPSEQALIETTLALTARLDVEQTCTAVLDAAERIYAARSSWVLVHDAGSNELVAVAWRGPDAGTYANARIRLTQQSVVGEVFQSRAPVFIPDVRAEDHWFNRERVQRSALQTVFVVPLVYEDVTLGVLGIDSPHFTQSVPPGAADTARLQAIAAHATIGIKHARLFEAIEQDRQRLRRLLDERRQLRHEVGYLRSELRDVHSMAVGDSAAFRHVLAQAKLVAAADSTVLLVGETGTGKELIARFIHQESRRSVHPFVAVNCAALPETLVESELFGYEKGAFTGAFSRRAGKFEIANRGTVLLDEIGDLPVQAQAKLLRVLQEREVQRVGGSASTPVNVRVIAATNQDLAACIGRGSFRPDLFYRLSVFPIYLPPLRERREDIPPLVEAFVRRFAGLQHKPMLGLAPGVMDRFVAYDWPGNVRELQNVVERSVILSRTGEITPDLLVLGQAAARPLVGRDITPAPQKPSTPSVVSLSEAERRAISRALELTGWRISGLGGAAEVLGLKPTTLHAKMKRLGIRRPSGQAVAAS